jgi:putative phosphoribosyl transferase
MPLGDFSLSRLSFVAHRWIHVRSMNPLATILTVFSAAEVYIMYTIFDDRHDAGRALVPKVRRRDLHDPLIFGLPRGGVPVAYEIAIALKATLDVLLVRKLGAPFQPELAVGAIASGGIRVLNERLINRVPGLDDDTLEEIVVRETQELQRREKEYRGERPFPGLVNRNIVLVDDGMATGATMRAAAESVRAQEPSELLIAVPTGSQSAVRSVSPLVDHVICLETPADFQAVGQFYRDFGQTTDEEVRELLDKARETTLVD